MKNQDKSMPPLLLPPLPKRPVGETKVWLMSIGLAVGLIMIFGLLGVIIYNGAEAFWPKAVYQWAIKGEDPDSPQEHYLASIAKERVRQEVKARGQVEEVKELQFYIANRELNGQTFKYIDAHRVEGKTQPEDVLIVSRMEGGNAIGTALSISLPDGEKILASDPRFEPEWKKMLAEAKETRAKLMHLERGKIGSLNQKLDDTRRELRLLEQSYLFSDGKVERKMDALTEVENPVERRAELQQQIEKLTSEYEVLAQDAVKLRQALDICPLSYSTANGTIQEIPAGNIAYYYYPNRLHFLDKCWFFVCRFWDFCWDDPREANTEGGIFPAIFGTFVMTVLMSMLVTPFGVIAAIYLREYAKQGALVQIIRICVNNLAGVPSIVFGVFGLGFFVYFVGGGIDQLFFWEKLQLDNTPTFGTPGILWASLTLALMTLPVVIVATEEALVAVPRGLREAALACGASKWQMIQRIILPSALPGVLTGLILAMARGAGEVAPLMMTGVVKLAPSLPIDGDSPFIHLERKFMHLGFHIYDVGFQSPDSEAAQPMVFATTLLLIALVVVMNLAAIMIRNKLRKKYQASNF